MQRKQIMIYKNMHKKGDPLAKGVITFIQGQKQSKIDPMYTKTELRL